MSLENQKTFGKFLHPPLVGFYKLVELILSYLFYIYNKAFYLSTEEKVQEFGRYMDFYLNFDRN
jgi:hypothetical protein